MTRRTRTELENEISAARAVVPKDLSNAPDWLANEVDALLEDWTPSERKLLAELVEDAATELQREMIHRAVVAKHTSAELHAFADEIRGLGDEALYALCTVDPMRTNVPVTARFRAEADPLYAMELNGRRLSPKLEDDPGPVYGVEPGRPRPRFEAPPALLIQPAPPRVAPPPKPSFESESSSARARPLSAHREIGASGEDVPSRGRTKLNRPDEPASPSPTHAGVGADAINEAVRGLGLSYRDHPVDTPDLPLERALELAAQALQKGLPVPLTLGRSQGERGRQALMLQVSPPGRTRAFQLHDPFSGETVWAHEKDLLGRTELPFDSKQWRRITAVALPAGRSRRSP